LFFGYLTKYKGIELLIESFRSVSDNGLLLVVAGGEPDHATRESDHGMYINSLKAAAKTISQDIMFTGFLRETEFADYFCAADLVVFPYPEMHAASGPFCLALSYRRPFLVSRPFGSFYGIPEELTFEYNSLSLAARIRQLRTTQELRSLALRWGKSFMEGRTWDCVARETIHAYRSVS
ncbi:unnamed protein product, partial [marine sediment metagenome]